MLSDLQIALLMSNLFCATKLVLGVVTWNNSASQLLQLVKSIEKAVAVVPELHNNIALWWIDNGDETRWPETTLLTERLSSMGNVGFGNSMNRMLEKAFANPSVEWFLCVNPDGVLHRQALQELLYVNRTHPQSLIEARQFPEEHRKTYDPVTLDTPWASGACLLICRALYEKIGGFDPQIWLYNEDVDFSWRARAVGFSVKIAPRALFGHTVLNRPPNPDLNRQALLSLRYLSWKWGNAEHQKRVEDQLLQAGLITSAQDLPPLPARLAESWPKEIPDFENYEQLALARWHD